MYMYVYIHTYRQSGHMHTHKHTHIHINIDKTLKAVGTNPRSSRPSSPRYLAISIMYMYACAYIHAYRLATIHYTNIHTNLGRQSG